MKYLQAYEQNKALYEKNKKEIFDKLLGDNYCINKQLVITIGITEFKIFVHPVKYLRNTPIYELNNMFNFVIAYDFID